MFDFRSGQRFMSVLDSAKLLPCFFLKLWGFCVVAGQTRAAGPCVAWVEVPRCQNARLGSYPFTYPFSCHQRFLHPCAGLGSCFSRSCGTSPAHPRLSPGPEHAPSVFRRKLDGFFISFSPLFFLGGIRVFYLKPKLLDNAQVLDLEPAAGNHPRFWVGIASCNFFPNQIIPLIQPCCLFWADPKTLSLFWLW